MHVLHVISSVDPRKGGPAVAVAGLARAQASVGLNVSILSTFGVSEDLSVIGKLSAAGVTVRTVGPCTGALLRHPELSTAVRESVAQAQVVHIHGLWEEIQHQAAREAARRGTAYLIRPCGMLDPWALSQKRWKKRLYLLWRMRRDLNRASAIHFTAAGERDMTAALRLKPKAIVEPIGIDTHEFEHLPARGTFRERFPQIGRRPLVVFVGRIHPGKGVEYLIPAMAQLVATGGWPAGAEPMLAVVGPDSRGFEAEMRTLARECGVTDRVVFAGMLRGADRNAALVDADILSLPSEHENFGLVAVEALAAGTPVVLSDQVQIYRELVEGGVAGAVPLEVPQLAQELGRWLRDHEFRQAAAQRTRAFVQERFGWEQIARRWAEHYADLQRPAAATGQRGNQ